jgi:hypothetical protein
MESFEFPTPWLNGHPIDAPKKIDMIDWYSQADGYYPDATENDSRNSVLTLFRFQGAILYEDEFRSETTINQNNSQTIGRVNRVFRAIDMISKYKAAYEDGADLSQSAIVDFETVWRDQEENVLPHKLMHNLQQVEEELRNRSPENSPVRAFWVEQETQRFKWVSTGPTTDDLHQDHPSTMDNPTDPIVPGYYHDQDLAVAVYVPNSQEYADSFRAVFADYFQSRPQNFSGWFGQEPQQPLTTLNPTTADFVPGLKNSASAAQAQKASTSLENGPINFTGEPATSKNELTVAELKAKRQKEYNWGERDDESWPGDDIFIPTFCRPKQPWSKPQLLGPDMSHQSQIQLPRRSLRMSLPLPKNRGTLARSLRTIYMTPDMPPETLRLRRTDMPPPPKETQEMILMMRSRRLKDRKESNQNTAAAEILKRSWSTLLLMEC